MKQSYLVTFTGENITDYVEAFHNWRDTFVSQYPVDVTINQVENFGDVTPIKEVA